MNKKVFISMLSLTMAYLVGCYILKIFFPQEFVMVITNEKFLAFGSFVDNNKWLYHIITFITSFITYWLYSCAILEKKYLNLVEIILCIIAISITKISYMYISQYGMIVSILCMVIVPCIRKCKSTNLALVLSIHLIAQALSLEIRNMPLRVDVSNFAVAFALTLECYFWLFLFYITLNYKSNKGEVRLWEKFVRPFTGKQNITLG